MYWIENWIWISKYSEEEEALNYELEYFNATTQRKTRLDIKDRDYYTSKEAQVLLGIGAYTISRYNAKWILNTYKVWNHFRVKKVDMELFLKEHVKTPRGYQKIIK